MWKWLEEKFKNKRMKEEEAKKEYKMLWEVHGNRVVEFEEVKDED